MSIRSKWIPTLALTLLLPLAACGGAEEGTDEMEGGMEEPAAAPAPTETGAMEPMSIMLEPRNESGVTGRGREHIGGESGRVVPGPRPHG